ncbi:MAG TPA: excinuclease ABC subunit UvrC [Candidatus Levybacteria bacterium]|nr:excinuclease ABC subunit UvrC [Candidatus Levybacteria bacterium]
MPSKPGVYLFKNNDKKIIYVGKAKDLKKRVSSYFQKSAHDAKTTHLVKAVVAIDHIPVNSEIEAFLLEAELIKKYKPYYNIRFTDDKSYPYIMITTDSSPYVSVVRKKALKNADYFGPYPDAGSVKIVLKILRRIFPFQSVKNHSKRKCLYYHLGLCPCLPADSENSAQYMKNLRNLKRFLGGKTDTVTSTLKKEQKISIKNEEFENASIIQKQIDSIKKITQETFDPFFYLSVPNAQLEREKNENDNLKTLLIQSGVTLSNLERIECYDISNFQGTNATGSMTVFINGSATTSEYRKFKIRKLSTPNDFAMHQEVMARRLKHTEWGTPDLIIVDGGKGQVSSVLQVFAHMGVKFPVIGLAKRFETIIIPEKAGRKIIFNEVRVPLSTPALNLVRRIRDEAHRFAISYHRKLRSKQTFTD